MFPLANRDSPVRIRTGLEGDKLESCHKQLKSSGCFHELAVGAGVCRLEGSPSYHTYHIVQYLLTYLKNLCLALKSNEKWFRRINEAPVGGSRGLGGFLCPMARHLVIRATIV